MNIIRYKYVFLAISGFLMAAAVISLFVFGLKQGIDFSGGTLWQLKIADIEVSREALVKMLAEELQVKEFAINADLETKTFLIRLGELNEDDHQRYLAALRAKWKGVEEFSFESIGPTIGRELRRKALTAFILVLGAISLYIAFVFRKVSRPVSSWKYGVITLLTLFHDAIIPVGLFAYLGAVTGVEVGVNFVVALLVIMGFSVHDTIVVFDRIRENLRLEKSINFNFGDLVNKSVWQTFARSVNTSLTLVLVLVALYFLGAASLSYFVLTILVGTVIGTYSSIFIASPLLVVWSRRQQKYS